MKFIVRSCFGRLLRSVIWKGRCGAVHLFQKDPVAGKHVNIYIMGVHVPHGELQIDTLADIGHLLRRRPWGSQVLVAGDWNIDQLPSMMVDPYGDQPSRHLHHQAERVLVQSLADRFRLTFSIPEVVYSGPGGPFNDICSIAPISRIPTGETAS